MVAVAAILLSVLSPLVPTQSLEAQMVRRAPGGSGGRQVGIGFNPMAAEPRIMMVEPGSLADVAGFLTHDVVVSLNGRPMSAHGTALADLMSGSEPLTFIVRRGSEQLTLTIGEGTDGSSSPPASAQLAPRVVNEATLRAYEEVAIELAEVLEARYLFPERGTEYADFLRTAVRDGRYQTAGDPDAFARQLTTGLNGVWEDRHLRVSEPGAPTPGRRIMRAEPGTSGGTTPEPVPESGWLTDEVAFMRIGLMPQDDALKAWAATFMEEHAEAGAFVLDLRMCRGGTLDMMNGFLPYLFGEETHLVNMDLRPGAADEVEARFDELPELRRVDTTDDVVRWEHTIVPSKTSNRPDMPVYILTGFTGSACEHLTMALKATGRATVIGSRTGGAGHYSTTVGLPGGYSLMLPIGRTYDPRTGEGWEIVGIEPDIAVDPTIAEERALELYEQGRSGRDGS
jgi:C-terminal processing protease CtpA/Prc